MIYQDPNEIVMLAEIDRLRHSLHRSYRDIYGAQRSWHERQDLRARHPTANRDMSRVYEITGRIWGGNRHLEAIERMDDLYEDMVENGEASRLLSDILDEFDDSDFSPPPVQNAPEPDEARAPVTAVVIVAGVVASLFYVSSLLG